MTSILLVASLPSVRLGLAAMLAEHGHTVLPEDEADESAVWVLDAPDAARLDALSARRYADLPRAAVVLTDDDPALPAVLARAGLRGWACLARETDADQLDLAVRAAEAGLVLLDLPLAANTLGHVAGVPTAAASELTPRELQVLQLVAQGLPNKGIARQLGISENT
ncbi:MAG TPA: LuxR C-terminal-related transcriptional regulator, partial [Chloroflexota bacterium]|nr:LuxR C-terminal-related transcriptional regulator [Chloroflexota bacterium]